MCVVPLLAMGPKPLGEREQTGRVEKRYVDNRGGQMVVNLISTKSLAKRQEKIKIKAGKDNHSPKETRGGEKTGGGDLRRAGKSSVLPFSLARTRGRGRAFCFRTFFLHSSIFQRHTANDLIYQLWSPFQLKHRLIEIQTRVLEHTYISNN